MHAAVTAGAWQRIVTSPLIRCRQFAEQCAAEWQVPVHVEHGFRELDFGEWEGCEVARVWSEDRERAQAYFSDPGQGGPPGGEPTAAFARRTAAAWDRTLLEYRGEHLLLVQHGGTIRALLTHVLAMPLSSLQRFDVPYAALSRICVHHSSRGDFPRLEFHNIGARLE